MLDPISMAANPTCRACVRPRNDALSIGSTALLVLLPKCPYCLVGWAGALGLGGYASHAMAIPTVVLVAFCASQAVFFIAMRRTGDKRALAAGALGVAAILASTWVDLSILRWAGVALLVVASTLNALSRARSLARTPAENFRQRPSLRLR